jgi:hypothetical protein
MKKTILIIAAIAALTIAPGFYRGARNIHNAIRISQCGYRMFQPGAVGNPVTAEAMRTFTRVGLGECECPPILVSSDGVHFYEVTRDEVYATESIGPFQFFITQNPHDHRWCLGRNGQTYYVAPTPTGPWRSLAPVWNPAPTSFWFLKR